jgi:hypothetical protein
MVRIITDRGPIWASTSNVRFLGRSQESAGSSRSRNSAVCITVMNASQRNDISPDGFLAKDRRKACLIAATLSGGQEPAIMSMRHVNASLTNRITESTIVAD